MKYALNEIVGNSKASSTAASLGGLGVLPLTLTLLSQLLDTVGGEDREEECVVDTPCMHNIVCLCSEFPLLGPDNITHHLFFQESCLSAHSKGLPATSYLTTSHKFAPCTGYCFLQYGSSIYRRSACAWAYSRVGGSYTSNNLGIGERKS